MGSKELVCFSLNPWPGRTNRGIRVAYDNNETLQMKTKFAAENCLGGSFVWAIDMEDAKNPEEKLVVEASGTKHPVSLAFLGVFSLCGYFLLSIV